MKRISFCTGWVSGLILVVEFSICRSATLGQTLEVLYSFQGPDGSHPQATMTQGTNGYWYGTTFMGGTNLTDPFGFGWGTVFKLATDGTLTSLFSFNGTNGGHLIYSPLVRNSDGSFYGTSPIGGNMSLNYGSGDGTIFRITDDGTFTDLVAFNNTTGGHPAGLIRGSDGNFYGVTSGGTGSDYGTVFKMTPAGTITTLTRFNNVGGLAGPRSLLQGSDGNFYGVTSGGSVNEPTVFKVTNNGLLSALASFSSSVGLNNIIQGPDGNLFGTTPNGGDLSITNASGAAGGGTVFRLALDGTVTTLVKFEGPSGLCPKEGLALSGDGKFYGRTTSGGDSGLGTIFHMAADGTLTTLYSFSSSDPPMQGTAFADLAIGQDGNLYGTTYRGGTYDQGTIFRFLVPPPPPPLGITLLADQILISWPTNAVGFTLQSSSDLSSSANWVDSTDTPSVLNDHYVVTNAISRSLQLYRLKQ